MPVKRKMSRVLLGNTTGRLLTAIDKKRRWLMDPTQNPRRWIVMGRPVFIALFLFIVIQWDNMRAILMLVVAIAMIGISGYQFVTRARNVRKVAKFSSSDMDATAALFNDIAVVEDSKAKKKKKKQEKK